MSSVVTLKQRKWTDSVSLLYFWSNRSNHVLWCNHSRSIQFVSPGTCSVASADSLQTQFSFIVRFGVTLLEVSSFAEHFCTNKNSAAAFCYMTEVSADFSVIQVIYTLRLSFALMLTLLAQQLLHLNQRCESGLRSVCVLACRLWS